MIKEDVKHLFDSQLNDWDTARNNYEALARVKAKSFNVNGNTCNVQFNPARITSSAAKIDPKSISERKCFLCRENLPPQQEGIVFKEHYLILVNPYPIFPRHLTIPDIRHTDQRIKDRIADMLDLSEALDDFIIFYNGPKCGASAPDHLHFQAGNKGFLPLEREWKRRIGGQTLGLGDSVVGYLNDAPRATLVIESGRKEEAVQLFRIVYDSMEQHPDDPEPMMNILAWYEAGRWVIFIFPREKHRPACYYAEGDANILLSPASVDLGGVFITPLEKDFNKITASDIASILEEVCISPAKFQKLRQRIKERL